MTLNDQDIPIISDDGIRKLDSGQVAPPDSWHSRRLYLGEQGASNWLDIVHAPNYPLHGQDPFGLNEKREEV